MTQPIRPLSPFFRRVYGAYTPDQITTVLKLYPPALPQLRLLEPFCGLGSVLPVLASRGHHVDAFDTNPAAVALVELRRPVYLPLAPIILGQLDALLARCPASPPHHPGRFDEGWIAEDIQDWFRHYAKLIPHITTHRMVHAEDAPRIAEALRCLPLLVARQITAYTPSDNASWLKAGGLRRRVDLKAALRTAAVSWSHYLLLSYPATPTGSITVRVADARTVELAGVYDGAFFSPPYANRLDYLRMLAPETIVLGLVKGDLAAGAAASTVLGTTVVRDSMPDQQRIARLPSCVRSALRHIRADSAKASATYYYPFFANYALGLDAALRSVVRSLSTGARGVVFIRDTPRKDFLFPSGEAVVTTLRSLGLTVSTSSTIVRHHIGMRRRRLHTSLQGLAQREWAVGFEKMT